MTSPAQPSGRQPSEGEVARFLADLDAWRAYGADGPDLWALLAEIDRSISQLMLTVSAPRLRGG
jgi:hypothetical protein